MPCVFNYQIGYNHLITPMQRASTTCISNSIECILDYRFYPETARLEDEEILQR
jgi:hypothetical protein